MTFGANLFPTRRNYATRAVLSLLIAFDADRDGDLDILTASEQEGRLELLRNDGSGSFLGKPEVVISYLHPRAIVAGDLDRDGDEDLAVTPLAGSIALYTNDGSGAFAPSVTLELGGDLSPPLLADVTGDGLLDVVVAAHNCDAQETSDIVLLANEGTGLFTTARRVRVPGEVCVIRAANLDGDPDIELAALAYAVPLDVHSVPFEVHVLVLDREPVGSSPDCDRNGVPDSCDADCNLTGSPDTCDIAWGSSHDFDLNGVPDECDADCDLNGIPDAADIARGDADCNQNGIIDACEARDGNRNGIPDDCDVLSGSSPDCDRNGVPDEVDLEPVLELAQSEHGKLGSGIALAYGDLDRDGTPDLIVSDGSSHRGLFGDGRGGFVERDLALGLEGVRSLVAADFDGDSRLDLAALAERRTCGSIRGAAALLHGEASGGFRRASMHEVGGEPRSALAAELGGRGLLDFVVLSVDGIWILFARGDGSFEPPVQSLKQRLLPLHRAMDAADLNGDGRLDLVTDGGLLLLQVADRSFRRGLDFPVGGKTLEEWGTGVAAADLDQDGDIDIVTGLVAGNRGDATFEEGPVLVAQAQGVTAGDWDGDGDSDVALAVSRFIEVRMNGGDGAFLPPVKVPTAADPVRLWGLDADLDQRLDIVALSLWLPSGRVSIHRNLGEGRFASRELPADPFLVGSLAAMDLDEDGDKDLATLVVRTAQAPRVLVLENRGDGTFDQAGLFVQEGSPTDMLAGDTDGDGDLDLILTSEGDAQGLYVLQNDEGNFGRRVDLPDVGRVDSMSAAELNGDAALDLIALDNDASSLSLLLGDGAGRFQRGPSIVRERLRNVVPADLDGDKNPEILVYAGRQLLVLSQERGTAIVETSRVPLGAQPFGGFAVADFDGDGAPDIAASVSECASCSSPILTCEGTPGISIILNRGKGAWEVSPILAMSDFSEFIAAVDLDGDADLDLAATLRVSGDCRFEGNEVQFFLNDGAGRFSSWGTVAAVEPLKVLMADLDADGLPEVLTRTTSGDLSILRNLTRPLRALDRNRDGVPDACERAPFRRGDWNQDGRRDLTDAVALLAWLFEGAEAHGCDVAGDVDDDGRLGITDPIRLLHHLFRGGAPPPEPFESCGEDPTADDLPCEKFLMCP